MNKTIIVIGLIAVMFLSACSQSKTEPFVLKEDGSFAFDACQDHGLGNSVIMVESAYCGHCRETRGDFKAACDETGITCEFWDIAEAEGLKELEDRDLMVQYTPTMIYGCSYKIGAQTKEEYIDNIQRLFLGEE